jgi:pimeloyl-ACP methyl ester carboxylesterase
MFLIRGAVRHSVRRCGPDFDKSPINRVKLINKPTMVMQNKNDPIADMDYVKAYFDALKVDKEMVWTDVGKSRIAGYADLTEHPEKIIEWFGRHLNKNEKVKLAVADGCDSK